MNRQKRALINEINDNIEFYETLSDKVFDRIDTIYYLISVGAVIFTATRNRLKTLRYAVSNGFISDGYVLTRMIYEDTLTFIYFKVKLGDGLVDNEIKEWIQGKKKLHNLRMPAMISFLMQNSAEINKCFDLLDVGGRYKNIKNYCNDYVHNNYLHNMRLNSDGVLGRQECGQHYERIAVYLKDLRNLLFASICLLEPSCASSSDYVDCLEAGLSPPDGSQYWVAPFMQKEFDRLSATNPPLAKFILDSSCMDFRYRGSGV